MLKKLLQSSMLISMLVMSGNVVAYDTNDAKEFAAYIDLVGNSAKQGEFSPMINRMSPAIINMISEKMGMSATDVVAFMTKISTTMLSAEKYDLEKMQYTADLTQVRPYTSATGREYVIIPIEMTMVDEENMYITKSSLVAIQENDVWYFNRVADARQVAMFKVAYPDITQLDIPESTADVVPR